jgi:hypothetical protein
MGMSDVVMDVYKYSYKTCHSGTKVATGTLLVSLNDSPQQQSF